MAGRGSVFALCAVLIVAAPCRAQLTNRIQFDSLKLSGLSADVGRTRPSQTVPANVYGLAADYGKLSRTLRLRLEASYWESRLTDDVMRTFADSLRRVVADPSRDDVVHVGSVTLYDVALGAGARWVPLQAAVLQPFIGAGIAVNVINAEGPAIDGTFVERMFDNVSTGFFAETGVMLKPLPRIGIDCRVRGDLLNGFRAVSARVGGTYYFGPIRRPFP